MKVLSTKFPKLGIQHAELYDGSLESIGAIIKMFGGAKFCRASKSKAHKFLMIDFGAAGMIGFNLPERWWVFKEGGICDTNQFVSSGWREVVGGDQ